ncbi:hypothetical protein SESBI_45317 [Sesbania bispinosa]|nr:hypothetical protein SESBI_45317 [Sesbania bispinosa]
MSQFNRNANWQNNNRESNISSIFRMPYGNGSSDHQLEVPIVPGIALRPLEETALNNTISESMGMNVSSPMSSLPSSSSGPRFPGRLFGSTILLDQLTPETNTNSRIVSPTPTTQGVVVEIHSIGEHEVNSVGGSSHENDQRHERLPFKRRYDHPLTTGEGSSNPGRGIPRRRVEEGNNTNTTSSDLPMNVGVGTGSASVMVSTAAEQTTNRELETTFVPTPTLVNYDPHGAHLPFANQPPASSTRLVYSVVPVEHVPLFYQVQQGYPQTSSMLRPPLATILAPATATTRGSVPNHLRGYSPPQFRLGIGNGNSTLGPSTIPNRPLQVANSNRWFHRVNVDEQYMTMPPPVVEHNQAFFASLMTRQTNSTLTQINNNFPGGWWRSLMAQNQRNRQLRDEILGALENELSFVDGLTEEQIMSHIGQEVVQSALENQDTSENEICSICQVRPSARGVCEWRTTWETGLWAQISPCLHQTMAGAEEQLPYLQTNGSGC